jgi:hypothetical protein
MAYCRCRQALWLAFRLVVKVPDEFFAKAVQGIAFDAELLYGSAMLFCLGAKG